MCRFGRVAKFLAQYGEGGLILKNQKKLIIEKVQGESLLTLSEYDGRWHIDLKAAGAATGRMAGGSHNSQGARLNAQGMSRRSKSLMSSVVADEGYVFVSRDLSAGEPTCYPEDITEFYTPMGWKRFDEIKEGDLVAQVDKDTLELSYVAPTNRTDYIYDGELVELSGKTGQYTVTSNHKMLYINPKRSKTRVVAAAGEFTPGTHNFTVQCATLKDDLPL